MLEMRAIRSLVACLALATGAMAAGHLDGLPTVPFAAAAGGDALDASRLTRIVVDERYAESRDTDGDTLIPPTLEDFAGTWAEDLATVGLDLDVVRGAEHEPFSVFLTIENDDNTNRYLDAAGRRTSEGYMLSVTGDGVTISGASPLGAWWGTRTVMQQLVLGNGSLPLGNGTDSPGWPTRGLMLDAGRHYYPPDFLVEMCAFMSYFKQNTFHLHLSDNLYNNVDIYSRERSLSLYAAFRLLSDDPAVAGLNRRPNESYTRDVFESVQHRCAARGVTVLPEIEAPGHALVITQWRPELGMSSDLSLLNISHPDTIPTVQKIWKTFLPWFHSKTVSIGADEYDDPSQNKSFLIQEYKRFVDALASYITGDSGKRVRIWSTFPPSQGGDVSRNISVQHWANFEANPYWDFVRDGYDVLNSGDDTYIVGKWSQSYPQSLDLDFLFAGSPGDEGGSRPGPFAPNVFDRDNATNNAARDDASLLGHVAAQWNDYGPNATTVLEAYYQWRDGVPALADKQWGGVLEREQYAALLAALRPSVPGQNLDRKIQTKTSTIVEYDFTTGSDDDDDEIIRDASGNGYHARTDCDRTEEGVVLSAGCRVATPLWQKGRNYTLTFSVKRSAPSSYSGSPAVGPLFSAGDTGLWSGNGSVDSVMLQSGGNAYAIDYVLPVGAWTSASLFTQGRHTFFSVGSDDDATEIEFEAVLGRNGVELVHAPIAVEAPLAVIGGGNFEGVIRDMKLVDDDF